MFVSQVQVLAPASDVTGNARLVLNRDSVLWKYFGDWRLGLVLGRGLLLQACHPTIGAGVAEHSMFTADPWHRLNVSLFPIVDTVYARDGDAVGRRIRLAHKNIGGVDATGRKYHAYEPEAYWWVLATALDSVVVMSQRYFDEPIREDRYPLLLAEMREVGRRMGLRDRDMPATWAQFRDSYTDVLANRLEATLTATEVVDLLASAPAPEWLPLRRVVGPAFSMPVSRAMTLATVGTVDPSVRELLGVRWTWADEQELRMLARVVRTGFGRLPAHYRYMPQARRGWKDAAELSQVSHAR